MISDNSKSLLKSKEVKEVLLRFGVRKSILTLPYHPTHNAVCERRIRTYRELFRKFGNYQNWVNGMKQINFICNTIPRKFQDGENILYLTPFQRYFYRSPPERIVTPRNVLKDVPSKPTSKDIKDMNGLVNKYILSLRKDFQIEHNKKGRLTQIKPGDLVLYKDMNTPKAGEIARKHKRIFHNRLFLCREINGMKSILEDLVTNTTIRVSTLHLRKYNERDNDFLILPQNFKHHIGDKFQFSVGLNTRREIILNLKKAGFNTDNISVFDEHIIDKTKIDQKSKSVTKNVDKSTGIDSSVSSVNIVSQQLTGNSSCRSSKSSKGYTISVIPKNSIFSKISGWKNRLRKRN